MPSATFGPTSVTPVKLLFAGVGQLIHRAEMRGEKLRGALADEADAERVDQARERVLFAGGNFIDQILRRLFGHAIEARDGVELQLVKVGEILDQILLSTSWSTILSPSPSIFMAWRPAKCRNDSLRRAGQETFTQR